MKAMKFKVENEEHSKAIQEHLLGLGGRWFDGSTGINIGAFCAAYIRIDTAGNMYYSTELRICDTSCNLPEWSSLSPSTTLDLSKYNVREIDVDKDMPMHIGGGRWLTVNDDGKVFIFESKRQAE